MNIQHLFDGMSQDWQRKRAEAQMTLGQFIDRLAELPPETLVRVGSPHSYRGYYCDLAFYPDAKPIPARDALTLAQKCMGEVFQGYKGGDYQMGRNTPIWLAHYGSCGARILAINDDGTLSTQEDA